MNTKQKKIGAVFVALVINILAVALNISFSKVLLNITGWTIISTEILPLLLCSIALFFILRRGKLSLIWGLVAHSFIYFEALINIEYLFNVPMIREKASIPMTFLIATLFLSIFILSLINLFKYHNWKFIGLLILFFGINIFNGFCGPYSPNVVITEIFFKLFNLK